MRAYVKEKNGELIIVIGFLFMVAGGAFLTKESYDKISLALSILAALILFAGIIITVKDGAKKTD